MDIYFFFIQKEIEYLNILKNIFNIIIIRTDYIHIKNNKNSNNILSYYIKPLNISNTLDTINGFDKNFKRNMFYLSKIKNISEPIINFYQNNSKIETYYQKNLSSFQIFNGPNLNILRS
jgi:hypothetical protein